MNELFIPLNIEKKLDIIKKSLSSFDSFQRSIKDLSQLNDLKRVCNVKRGRFGPPGFNNCPCSPDFGKDMRVDDDPSYYQSYISPPKQHMTDEEWKVLNDKFNQLKTELNNITESDGWEEHAINVLDLMCLHVKNLEYYLHTILGSDGEPGWQSGVCNCPSPKFPLMYYLDEDAYYHNYIEFMKTKVTDINRLIEMRGSQGSLGLERGAIVKFIVRYIFGKVIIF